MRILARILALFAFAAYAHGQTFFTIVPASQQSLQTVVTVPAGGTYQVVALPCPKPSSTPVLPVTVTVQTNVTDYADGQNGRPQDSCPGTQKAFQIAETAVQQTINWTINGVAQTPVVVPALPAPPVKPVKTWSCTANTAVTFSLMSDGTFQVNGPVACKETL